MYAGPDITVSEYLKEHIHGIDAVSLDIFDQLYELHNRYRKRGGLSGRMNKVEYCDEFIIDAWEALKCTNFKDGLEVGDIGSGGGYPGLPLYIFKPTINLKLVESNKRKAEYLRMLIMELGLSGVAVIPERAENINCSFDIVVSKGLGVKLFGFVNRLIKENGELLLFGSRGGGLRAEVGPFRLDRKHFYKPPSKRTERVISVFRASDVSRET